MSAPVRTFVALGLVTALTGGVILWAAPGLVGAAPSHPQAHRLHVRVWESGAVAPSVSVNIPLTLVTATLELASMTGILDRTLEMARRHAAEDCGAAAGVRVSLRGRDIVALWTAMASAGPADLVSVEDGAGGRVQIRID
jgi:hypothetical protein